MSLVTIKRTDKSLADYRSIPNSAFIPSCPPPLNERFVTNALSVRDAVITLVTSRQLLTNGSFTPKFEKRKTHITRLHHKDTIRCDSHLKQVLVCHRLCAANKNRLSGN